MNTTCLPIQKQLQKLKTSQLQSLQYLSMNYAELEQGILELSESNPLLELDQHYYQTKEYEIREDHVQYEHSFRDDLLYQLHTGSYPDQQACEIIITALDHQGYFRSDIAELAHKVGIRQARLSHALVYLQTLEPCGVGARDLSECLKLQIKRGNYVQKKQLLLLCDHLKVLAKGYTDQLKKLLHCQDEELAALLAVIKQLHPRPCLETNQKTRTLVPDIFLALESDDLVVTIRDITQYIKKADEYQHVSDKETKRYVAKKTRELLQLLNQVSYRNKTLQAICAYLFEVQKQHFLRQEPLRSLQQREVALSIGCHISTVSRCISNKSFQFENRIYLLSSLFSKAVDAKHSSAEVKACIYQMVSEEVVPLQDEQIMEMLQLRGVRITRRTVSKYRTELQFPNASKRKLLHSHPQRTT